MAPPPQMVSAPGARGTQYVSTDELDPNADQAQMGDGMTVAVGSGYVFGLLGGGAYGVRRGLQISEHQKHLTKLRVNAVLNQAGRHGSRTGNMMGISILMIKMFEKASATLRGTEDNWNFAAGSAVTGFLLRSPRGPVPSLVGGAYGGILGAVFSLSFREKAEGWSLEEHLPPRRW